ncbi:M1 family aminopeptidase [Granulicella cerasi]|uniref:M1 family aminopeptidase n=1 Tax=Granulicella cerasi TaxID=741063 RepID=A0ABW1ZG67_9BACT|nr:M1 family aminopeptidase [Granulicella cerasi]
MIKRLTLLCTLTLGSFTSLHAAVPTRAQVDVTGYVIHADLDPASGQLKATVAVTFTALDDLNSVLFGLNNGLQVASVTDATNAALTPQRNAADSTVAIALTTPMAKGSSTTWTFTYAGAPNADTSPITGINFVSVKDPISVLLYPGRWFPIAMPGLYTDRFTAETHITVPKDERVVGSGFVDRKDAGNGRTEYTFNWTKPGMPGTIVAGKFLAPVTPTGIPNVRVYTTEASKDRAQDLGMNTVKAFEFLSNAFGPAESGKLEVVELPTDSVSANWGPEVVALRPTASQRLTTNIVAHQWFGSMISPQTLNDAWITNGLCRYSELLFLEDQNGKSALQAAITDTSAAALAYDTDPLTTLARVDPFSPQFQDATYDKGAMVFHMLRRELGDDAFLKFVRGMLTQFTDKPIRTSQVQRVAEDFTELPLTAFFSQWLDGTGAPEFTNNYSVFRLGKGKGFRTVGSVTQDLDLFSMPVQLRVETEGKSEDRRVDLSGTDAKYSIETFGRPRRIILDPENWLLKSSPDLAVKIAILRGQQDLAQGDQAGAIAEYQKALQNNRGSSLANYRLAEVFMQQHNYQTAANSFRDALRGDGDPRWVEVWSHVNLGKIFDITGQRERAVNEYRQAIQTNDNTQGAINEARAYSQKPYKIANDE